MRDQENQRFHWRNYYHRNKAKLLPSIKERRQKHYEAVSRIIMEAKSVPCVDCKVEYPPFVMDFDHVRGTKLFTIAAGRHKPLKSVVAEIAKCEVVCANCHRFRTAARMLALAE